MSTVNSVIAGRYQLIEQIGSGGMGRVWLAFDQILRRDVAVKELAPPPHLTGSGLDRARTMMVHEAQAAAQVCHPNVVRVYDILDADRDPWIIMEYVPSRSLHHLIKAHGPATPEYTATIGLALLDALTAAHRVGVLHRDVTPQNVLIARDGRIMLTDFGVAQLGTASQEAEHELAGTARYIPPERVAYGICTPAGDLWSLGATLYAAVEGRSPYARSSVAATLRALATAAPDPPRRAGALLSVLNGLLAREPSERWSPPLIRASLERLLDRASASFARSTPAAGVLTLAAP